MADPSAMPELAEGVSMMEVNDLLSDQYSSIDTVVNDPVFSAFQASLADGFHDVFDRWTLLCHQQSVWDLTSHLAWVKWFVEKCHKEEPGEYIDYIDLFKSFEKVSRLGRCSEEERRNLSQYINNLRRAHTNYMNTTIGLAGWELQDKMLDRLHDRVKDEYFRTFVECTVPDAPKQPSGDYHELKDFIKKQINQLRSEKALAITEVQNLKDSIQLRHFIVRLSETNRLEAEGRGKRKVCNIPQHYQHGRHQPHSPHKQSRAQRQAQMRRKLAIAHRNSVDQSNRDERNASLREQNRNNVHQFGNVARTQLSNGVIHALSMVTEQSKETLFEKDDPYDDIKKASKAAADKGAKESDSEDLQHAMQGMTVDDIDDLQAKMKEKEPTDGIFVSSSKFNVSFFGA